MKITFKYPNYFNIFMIKELTEFFIPLKILHRENQIKKIKSIFKNFQEQGIAENLLVQGVTGSGKTAVITKVVYDEDGGHIFISGASTKTAFRTLKAIVDLKYNTADRLLSEGIRKLNQSPKIIIIDEINKIKDLPNTNISFRRTE